MTLDEKKRQVRAVLNSAEKPIGPTEIARRIGEWWCYSHTAGTSYPQSSRIVPVLRKMKGVRRHKGGRYSFKRES